MINIENRIYTILKETIPGVNTSSVYVEAPSEFPHVSIIEEDQALYTQSSDSDNIENHVRVVYGINVYTMNNKAEAKNIIQTLDSELMELGFTRDMLQQIPNEQRGIYRMYGRYEAIVSTARDVNGVDTYFIYRR